MIITIDGPAGSGKSTAARKLAAQLEIAYLDTGAMYRAIAFKGLKERVVVLRHALKNALIPIVTIWGMQVPFLLGGTVIIEQIFGLPGIGRLLVDAIAARDEVLISGLVLIMAVVVMVTNLIVDLIYGYLDPRIHYD